MSLSGLITRDLGDIAAIGSAIGVGWAHIRLSRATTERAETRSELDTVHKAVNSTAAGQNARIEQLTATLAAADVKIPERPPA